jgi:lysozyme
MALDPQYLDAIKGFEGYSPDASWDYKQYSSGYGTKAQPGDENIPPDQRQAVYDQRFQDEVGKAASSVDSFAPNLPSGVRAALASLTYNAGPGWQQSGLGAAVKAGDFDKAKELFLQYNHAGGKENAGLTGRRQAEAAWFGQGGPPQQPQQVAQAAPAPQQPVGTLPQGQAPVFPQAAPQAAPQAPQGQAGGDAFAPPQAGQIYYAPRRAPDLSGLQQALGNRGAPFFARG